MTGQIIDVPQNSGGLVIDDPDFSGQIRGSDGGDRLTVTTDDIQTLTFHDLAMRLDSYAMRLETTDPAGENAIYDPRTDFLNGDSSSTVLRGLTEIQGGAGDDTITASGSDMWIEDGGGADLIDVSGLRNGMVFAGAGDTVIGSDHGDVLVYGSDGLTYFGSDLADDRVMSSGAATLHGGAGDDELAGGSAGSALYGGDGDDTLWASDRHAPWADGRAFGTHVLSDDRGPYAPDVSRGMGGGLVDGGAGDDLIYFGEADTVTGGEGADELWGYLPVGTPAVLTDFDPAEDRARITVPALEASHPTGGITVMEQDGDSILMMGGQPILHLAGVTGLQGVVDLGPDQPEGSRHVDLSGNPATGNPQDWSLIIAGR